MPAEGRTYSVLVVEGEAPIVEMVCDSLEDTNFVVVGTCASAEAAFELAIKAHPQLALIGVTLKGERDGLWLAAELASELAVRCIIMTDSADPLMLERIRRLGADLLCKPFGADLLAGVLERAVAARTAR